MLRLTKNLLSLSLSLSLSFSLSLSLSLSLSFSLSLYLYLSLSFPVCVSNMSLYRFKTCRWKALTNIEERELAAHQLEVEDQGEEEQQEDEGERARLAQVLDELLGEDDVPCQVSLM